MSHTPGPWTYAGYTPREGWVVQITDLVGSAGRRIMCEGRSAAEAEANARLVAAAPDLLAALEAVTNVAIRDEWDKATTGRQILLRDAITAVKKARGES